MHPSRDPADPSSAPCVPGAIQRHTHLSPNRRRRPERPGELLPRPRPRRRRLPSPSRLPRRGAGPRPLQSQRRPRRPQRRAAPKRRQNRRVRPNPPRRRLRPSLQRRLPSPSPPPRRAPGPPTQRRSSRGSRKEASGGERGQGRMGRTGQTGQTGAESPTHARGGGQSACVSWCSGRTHTETHSSISNPGIKKRKRKISTNLLRR